MTARTVLLADLLGSRCSLLHGERQFVAEGFREVQAGSIVESWVSTQGRRISLKARELCDVPSDTSRCLEDRAVSRTPDYADLAVKRFFCRSWAEEDAAKDEILLLAEAGFLQACVQYQGAYAAPVYPEGVEFFLCMT